MRAEWMQFFFLLTFQSRPAYGSFKICARKLNPVQSLKWCVYAYMCVYAEGIMDGGKQLQLNTDMKNLPYYILFNSNKFFCDCLLYSLPYLYAVS